MATIDGNVADRTVSSSAFGRSTERNAVIVPLIGGGGIQVRYKLRATTTLAPFIVTWTNSTGDDTNRPPGLGPYGTTFIVGKWYAFS